MTIYYNAYSLVFKIALLMQLLLLSKCMLITNLLALFIPYNLRNSSLPPLFWSFVSFSDNF